MKLSEAIQNWIDDGCPPLPDDSPCGNEEVPGDPHTPCCTLLRGHAGNHFDGDEWADGEVVA